MNVVPTPSNLELVPGEPGTLTVEVFNTNPVISAYSLRVFGLDARWIAVDEEELHLFPESSGFFVVTVTVPPDLPAGTRTLALEVSDLTDGTTRVIEVDVEVAPRPEASLELRPTTALGGSAAEFGLVVANTGNSTLDLALSGSDEEEHLSFEFSKERVEVAPGDRETVSVRARGRRPLIANPAARAFTITAAGTDVPLSASGAFIQKPRFSRGILGLFGLLAGVTVFAVVMTSSLGRIVDTSKSDRDLLVEMLQARDRAAALENPASVGGKVTQLTSGDGVGGVTVQLFDAAAVTSPLASTATSDDGSYEFGQLAPGTYKIRFQGAGFAQVWYPRSVEAAEAEPVEVAIGQHQGDVDVALGGVPGSVAGVVVGADPAGATVRISALPVAGAVAGADQPELSEVAAVEVDDTGEFDLAEVPSPASYELSVEKPGFALEARRIDLAAGERRENVEIQLRKGDGTISGVVVDPEGTPVGAATVEATDGITTVSTVTLTRGQPGHFTIRELATPGTFTLTVERDGFAVQTVSVNLARAATRDDLSVTLSRSSGSISGSVAVEGAGPTGGVRITVTSGDLVVETFSLTSATERGEYLVSGLPVPGTYTVSYSRADLVTQTRAVDLDPFTSRDVANVNVSLRPATATVFGTVTDISSGDPVDGASVSVVGGTTELSTVSASTPPGAYELRNIPPGTYTVTITRPGSSPRSRLLNLAAGDRTRVDARLDEPASISGVVSEASTLDPLEGAEVKLYKTSEFPNVLQATVITGSDGSFRFEAVDAPDQFTLLFSYPPNTPSQKSHHVAVEAGAAVTNIFIPLEVPA